METETNTIKVAVLWTVRERRSDRHSLVVARFKNIVTTYGITAYAQAPGGWANGAPSYLVLESTFTTVSATAAAGATSIQTAKDPTISGDTQLVLSVGQAAQEVVTFTTKTGTGPYTFALKFPTVNIHSSGDFVVRQPQASDTLASVTNEVEYDHQNFPGQRAPVASSFSPGTGQGTIQFFIAGITAANLYIAHVGLADSQTIGGGNLHNYAALGYNHNNNADLEIDANYVLTGG